MVTALYTAILAIWLIVLSFRVIALRGNPAFSFFAFGKEDSTSLDRAIRGHGNLTEYAPMMLLLLFFLEQQGASAGLLHGLGGTFLLGRLMHGFCFAFMKKSMVLRIGGMVLTLTCLLLGAALLLL
ncbi:MAG: MAPEG family protein [Pseudomonadota bacterium]